MYVIIIIILIIASFIIGYKTSINRLKADDVDWLKNRLYELGYPFSENSQNISSESDSPPKNPSGKKKSDSDLENIVKQQKSQIRAAFMQALKVNLAKGDYNFDHLHDAYSILPKPATVKVISELITEFQEDNPSLHIKGSLLYSEYRGKYYISMKVNLV